MSMPTDWPIEMPGADENPHGDRATAATLLNQAGSDLQSVRVDVDSTFLPATVRKLAQAVISDVGRVRGVVHQAAADLDALAASDLIPAKGRDRLIREKQETTEAALRELGSRSDTSLKLLEAGLTAAAQPPMPAGADRAELRERVKMLADASADPSAVVRALVAGSDEGLAAIAASPWAKDYLTSRRVPADVIASTAVFAAQAAMSSGNPHRRAAAVALTKLDELRKARAKALNAAAFALGFGR